MSAAESRHPSDADRERDAIEVLGGRVGAVARRDLAGLTAYLDDEVVLPREEGRSSAPRRSRGASWRSPAGAGFDMPQQQGAKAVLRYRREVGIGYTFRGALVVEVRRGRIIFAATL